MSDAAARETGNHPMLTEFSAPLPRLMEDVDDLSSSVSRFGELLGSRQEAMSIGFRFVGKNERYLLLRVGPRGAEVAETEPAEQADLEIIAVEETWRNVACGTISPLTAMANGLRVCGDAALALRIVHQLHSAGRTSFKEG